MGESVAVKLGADGAQFFSSQRDVCRLSKVAFIQLSSSEMQLRSFVQSYGFGSLRYAVAETMRSLQSSVSSPCWNLARKVHTDRLVKNVALETTNPFLGSGIFLFVASACYNITWLLLLKGMESWKSLNSVNKLCRASVI